MAAEMPLLFLGKAAEESAQRAAAYAEAHFPGARVLLGGSGKPFPSLPAGETYGVVLSYLAPWIVPAEILSRARRAAINFHPGPPEYPGIGCTNFAFYDGVKEYGVTCHHMAPRVDTGAIIRVVRFPVHPTDTVLTVTRRCYAHIATLFYEMVDVILAGGELSRSAETWKRKPYTRSDFNGLLRLTRDMSPEEVRRRVRATTYPGHPAASYDDGGAP
jgi:methionyl-tRNA formyltransferase